MHEFAAFAAAIHNARAMKEAKAKELICRQPLCSARGTRHTEDGASGGCLQSFTGDNHT
jgi:hypothetical protein